jgi:hypothetical protein
VSKLEGQLSHIQAISCHSVTDPVAARTVRQ